MQPLRGKYIKAKPSDNPVALAVDASLKKAIRETGSTAIGSAHLMEKIRISGSEGLYMIVLDNSSSMRLDKKIRLAKTLSWLLLNDSYTKKNLIALITFGNNQASVTVQPTRDPRPLDAALEAIKSGGKTPLTPAIYESLTLARKYPNKNNIVFIISDGKANLFKNNSLHDDLKELQQQKNKPELILINTSEPFRSNGILEEMAEIFKSKHFFINDLI